MKVFISYSHDSEEHKDWVYNLACRLVSNGVDVVLDQWDVRLGSNLIKFMESGLTGADRVLVICTDTYIVKANAGVGGVGYEKIVLTSELYASQDTEKFIPCVRGVSGKIKTPICLSGRAYIDFSNDNELLDRLNELLRELHGVPERPKPKLGPNPFKVDTGPKLGGKTSTSFFAERFASVFPGVRGISWIKSPEEAVKRLALFFREPYFFADRRPIWWWRDGDMHIDSFSVLNESSVLIDCQEFNVSRLAAVNAGEYYQSFIYLETLPSEPTGLYPSKGIDDQIEHWGYAREEFALFRGMPIKRTEYDDGATIINGEVVQLNHEAELRVRYLTRYNVVIAPNESPINNGDYDKRRVDLMNRILLGTEQLKTLVDEVKRLPRQERRF